MEVGDFNIVAKTLLKPTRRWDVALAREAGLILGEPLIGIRADVAKTIELGVELVFNHAAIAQVRRRVGLDGADREISPAQ